MGLSVLLGSSLFILAVVTSLVIFGSPQEIQLNKWFFMRDCFFLLAAEMVLLYATLIRGAIDMPMSISFIVLYLVYVIFVLCQDRFYKPTDSKAE